MQLMCDALAVLGSRHGILWNPIGRRCGIIRYGEFHKLPELHLRAGAVIGGRELAFPLAPGGTPFGFLDQRISPCTMSMIGVDPESAIKVRLTVATPFRPRDAAFSTTPVLAFRLEASSLGGHFRWTSPSVQATEVELFLEVSGPALSIAPAGADAVEMRFESRTPYSRRERQQDVAFPQRDTLVGLTGERRGTRFVRRVAIAPGARQTLDVAWCTWDEARLRVLGEDCPFKYRERFASLDEVAAWARANPSAVADNARCVDSIIGANTCSKAVNNLLAQSLHSWLICTWYARRAGRDWFSVWEGSCYFHSTVDVEYTQSPFYLAVWPELLAIELEQWTGFAKPGERTAGAAGEGTLFLSHDMGSFNVAEGQDYHHEMEVEETTNWVILAYAHWRRTGDDAIVRGHAGDLARYLAFVKACDTDGDGVPDVGVANTIDDASPAVQFGRGQVYLAVKVMAAYAAGAAMLEQAGGDARLAAECRALAARIRDLLDGQGWKDDHYATLLFASAEGLINPWTKEKLATATVPGWDSAHIYTVNGMAVLDMVGLDLGVDRDHLARDLVVATARCLREYGCIHSDYGSAAMSVDTSSMQGLAGVSTNPGWVSMNMLRDIAAAYRGVDLRYLADRYWDWQVVTNTQEPKVFFETFNGNNLCFYPRGVAIWGLFDALAGLVIDRVAGVDEARRLIAQVRVPRMIDADWASGTCVTMGGA